MKTPARADLQLPAEGRRRAVIDRVAPGVDCGDYPVKRVIGESVCVEADVLSDGHDSLRCVLRYRPASVRGWREAEMTPAGNDVWRAEFVIEEAERYYYSVIAWVDAFTTWRNDLVKRREPADIETALVVGNDLVIRAARRARGVDGRVLREHAQTLLGDAPLELRIERALSGELRNLMQRYAGRGLAAESAQFPVAVESRRARYSAWYEFFPRSAAAEPGRHGTLKDCIARLDYVAELGFDIVYLPPIHPIGEVKRKGRNNALTAAAGDPGSPWAIGSTAGGHKAVHPALGTLDDFRALVAAAGERNMDIALDIAFQCAPDHPYVSEHPDWFRHRPDGSIQYAENPPKKYEDIYPFDFECEDWRGLWAELKSIFAFWMEQGVRVFRVDNPHTKPLPFWEWVIAELKKTDPQVIFLSEAFTRPKIMRRLAKAGFTQSYTYFPWRNTREELVEYFTELATDPSREYFLPNHWTNTPDILTAQLQQGGRPVFMARLVLAATLGANYGVYGPAYEQLERVPRTPGSEEYLDSEKYQIRYWDLARSELAGLMRRLNEARRAHPALQQDWNLHFLACDNPQLICYLKHTADMRDAILVVVNLEHRYTHSGWVEVPLQRLGIPAHEPYQVADLLTGEVYTWRGAWNYVALDPHRCPAHVLHVERAGDSLRTP